MSSVFQGQFHRRSTIERPRARTPIRGPHFLPRNLVQCSICYAKVCPFVSLSVRPSVTLVSHALRVQNVEICVAAQRRFWFLETKFYNTEFRACGRNDCVKQRHPLARAKIGPIIRQILETCKIGRKLRSENVVILGCCLSQLIFNIFSSWHVLSNDDKCVSPQSSIHR